MNAWDAVVALAELVVAEARLQTRLKALEVSQAAFLERVSGEAQ